MPPPLGGSSGGCPAVWSICQHRGYCSRESTIRPPDPCGSSCRDPLLGRQPLCRHLCHQLLPWLRLSLAWSPMQPGRAWTSVLGVPLLPLARGRLGRPSESDPGVVDRCIVSLCCPRCICLCGVLAHTAPVHRCARCGGCVPPKKNFISFLFFFSSVFVLFCFAL